MTWYSSISKNSLRWIMNHLAHSSLRSLNWSLILPLYSNGRSSSSRTQRYHIINTYLSFSICMPRHLGLHLLKPWSVALLPLVVFMHMHPTRLSLHSQLPLYLKPTTALYAMVKKRPLHQCSQVKALSHEQKISMLRSQECCLSCLH